MFSCPTRLSRRIFYRPAFCVKVDVSPQRHVHFCVESDVAKSDQKILVRQPSHVFGVQKRTFRRKPFSFHRLASFLAVAVNSSVVVFSHRHWNDLM